MTELTLNSAVAETAKEMLDRHSLRALDAIQLASCWVGRITSGMTDIVFVASDHTLLAAAKTEGLQILNPEEL